MSEVNEVKTPMGRPRVLTIPQRLELRRLRGDGCTLRECAAWFHTSRASISRYLAMPEPTMDDMRAEVARAAKPRKTGLERRIDRFWAKVENANVRGCCWLWKGYTKPSGHGLTTWNSRPLHAHRLAWILKRGPIEEGLCINHKCHNPLCCNPNHLYVGTREQNMADYWGRTRYRVKKVKDNLSPDSNTLK